MQPLSITSVRRVPRGKGIFVRGVASVGGPQRILDMAKYAGLEWVAVQSWWKDTAASGGYNPNWIYTPALAAALRAEGIDFWSWGWPYPWQTDAFAQAVGGAGAFGRGAILDIEGPEWEGGDAELTALVSMMRAELDGRGLGLTSYGWPPNFPEQPWSTAPLFDFGMNQAYLAHEVYGEDFQADSVASYEELGFRAVVPLLAAYDLTEEQMVQIHARTPKPAGAVGWWDFANADADPARWDAIRGVPASRVVRAPSRSSRPSKRARFSLH